MTPSPAPNVGPPQRVPEPPDDALCWPVAEPGKPLATEELHVWSALQRGGPAFLQRLEQEVLATAELERAARFRFEPERRRYLVARGILRLLLAGYLNQPPRDIEIAYGPHGKPFLADPTARLRFNASHSQGVALYAFVWNHEVGVDVEAIHSVTDMARIAERFFAPGENERWRALPEPERARAFFLCWTRKEAFLKAKGVGIGGGLGAFEVSLAPREPATLLSTRDPLDSAAGWTMFSNPPASGYEAAIVVRAPGIRPVWQRWAPP